MSEQNPGESEQGPLTPPDQTLLPPSYDATPPPPMWTPPPTTAPADSMWNRVAAFLVLIAVVAAAGGAGIGWSLARAVNGSHPTAQATARRPARTRI